MAQRRQQHRRPPATGPHGPRPAPIALLLLRVLVSAAGLQSAASLLHDVLLPIEASASSASISHHNQTDSSIYDVLSALWMDLDDTIGTVTPPLVSEPNISGRQNFSLAQPMVSMNIGANSSAVPMGADGNTDNDTDNDNINRTSPDNDNSADNGLSALLIGVIGTNVLIFLTGFTGNLLVITVILKFTKIESVTDIYILNLAFADLLFISGLVIMIITMSIGQWIFGELMCKASSLPLNSKCYMGLTSLSQFASSLLLVVMSIDRYMAICRPIYAQTYRQMSRTKLICVAMWFFGLILTTPIVTFATAKDSTCTIMWPEYKTINVELFFTLYSFTCGFAIPLTIIMICYWRVVVSLRSSVRHPINHGSRSASREKSNRRVTTLVKVIVFTYMSCWSPYWTSQLYVTLTTSLEFGYFPGFYPFLLIATCLSYTNSALNPVLYAFLSGDFKRRFLEALSSLCPARLRPRQQSNERLSTGATALRATNSCLRPESRQTVIMNETVRLVTSPSQLPGINVSDEYNYEEETEERGGIVGDGDADVGGDNYGELELRCNECAGPESDGEPCDSDSGPYEHHISGGTSSAGSHSVIGNDQHHSSLAQTERA